MTCISTYRLTHEYGQLPAYFVEQSEACAPRSLSLAGLLSNRVHNGLLPAFPMVLVPYKIALAWETHPENTHPLAYRTACFLYEPCRLVRDLGFFSQGIWQKNYPRTINSHQEQSLRLHDAEKLVHVVVNFLHHVVLRHLLAGVIPMRAWMDDAVHV